MAEQTYRNFELIVVDDGSDDQTRIIGRDLEKKGLIDLFISNDVRGGKASGANIALQFAKGNIRFILMPTALLILMPSKIAHSILL